MSNIHFVLTGKGGVGKSYIAAILSQYLGPDTLSADTDPSNPTLCAYKAIGAKYVNIVRKDLNVDKSRFDGLMDMLLEHEGDCLIDNGSSSFLPMMAYMLENDVVEALSEAGKTVIFHAVLIGGGGFDETLRGLESMLKTQTARVVVWENELYGPVLKGRDAGTLNNLYSRYKQQIVGVVRIDERGSDTFGQDLHKMTSLKLTFEEVRQSSEFATFSKSRINRVRNDIYSQLDQLDFA